MRSFSRIQTALRSSLSRLNESISSQVVCEHFCISLNIARGVVFAGCLPGRVPHQPANNQRRDSGVPETFPTRSSQVMGCCVLHRTASPLICGFDDDARRLSNSGDHLSDPFRVWPVMTDFATHLQLERQRIEYPTFLFLSRCFQQNGLEPRKQRNAFFSVVLLHRRWDFQNREFSLVPNGENRAWLVPRDVHQFIQSQRRRPETTENVSPGLTCRRRLENVAPGGRKTGRCCCGGDRCGGLWSALRGLC